jgi:hypothetical protein
MFMSFPNSSGIRRKWMFPPNMSVNRTRYGMAPWPRGALREGDWPEFQPGEQIFFHEPKLPPNTFIHTQGRDWQCPDQSAS